MLILESGSFAKDRITKDDLINTFNTVIEIVNTLKDDHLLKDDPQFNLGSTKLAYRMFQKKLNNIVPDIDDDDLNAAEAKRLESGFGDLDIDLTLADGISLMDVEDDILDKFQSIIYKSAPRGERKNGQLHFGFKINGKVHQVDFVEIKGDEDRKAKEYFNGSSATDEANGIKGLFNKEMDYTLAGMIPDDKMIGFFAKKNGKSFEDQSAEFDSMEKVESEKFKQELKYNKMIKGYIVTVEGKKYPVISGSKEVLRLGKEITDENNIDVTPAFEVDAVNASCVVISKRKVGLIQSQLQNKYGLTYRVFFYRQKYKQEGNKVTVGLDSTPKKVILDYIPITQQDLIVKALLGNNATPKELFSAVETAKFIGKNFPDDKKLEFWEAFIKQALRKRDKVRLDRSSGAPSIDPETGQPETSGQVPEADYDKAMKLIGTLIGINNIVGHDFHTQPQEGKIDENYNSMVYNEEDSIKSGIGRLEGTGRINDEKFLELLKALYPCTSGNTIYLTKAKNADLVEKVDSSFCNFGINKAGKFFLASNNSGEVTEDNFEQKFQTNPDFLESFRFLKDDKLLLVVLKNIMKETGKPVKFEAEILPSLTYQADERGEVTFIGTKYAKEKIGEKGAFVVFKAQVFEHDQWSKVPLSVQKKLISDILDADSKQWKVYSNDVHMQMTQDIHVGVNIGQLDKYLSTDAGFQKLQQLMDSKSTPEKQRVKAILTDIRTHLQAAIEDIANSLKSNLGNDFAEGVILRVKNDNGEILEIKGISKKFTENKKKLWEDRDGIESLYDSFKNKIKTNILHLKFSSDRSINQKFIDVLPQFKATSNTPEGASDEFLVEVLNNLIDSNADFSNVREVARQLVEQYKVALQQIKVNYMGKQPTMDVNAGRKISEAFSINENKFNKLFSVLLSNPEDDLHYVLSCFKAIYEGKALSLLKSVKPSDKVPTTKCCLWVGRAQPWHKGHDEMIKIGLQNSEIVYVIIIKGEEENDEKNPLNAETQKELIRALYGNKVIVSDHHPSKVSLPFMMMDLYSKVLEADSWLVGEERVNAYKGELGRFNCEEWSQGHKYIPIPPTTEFVVTPRVVSGTEAREATKNMDFNSWVAQFAPENLTPAAKSLYKKAYLAIKGPQEQSLSQTISEMFLRKKL